MLPRTHRLPGRVLMAVELGDAAALQRHDQAVVQVSRQVTIAARLGREGRRTSNAGGIGVPQAGYQLCDTAWRDRSGHAVRAPRCMRCNPPRHPGGCCARLVAPPYWRGLIRVARTPRRTCNLREDRAARDK